MGCLQICTKLDNMDGWKYFAWTFFMNVPLILDNKVDLLALVVSSTSNILF